MAEDKEKKDPAEAATNVAKKSVGLVETLGCCCLNLAVGLIILFILAIITMIVSAVSNPLDVIANIFDSLWQVISK